jgi:drug/metabolite transporter (DMT)-like permease
VTYLIYFRLLARIGSTRTSLNTYLQPVAGVLVLGEALGARAVLAMAVTFAGVATFAAGSRDHLCPKRQFSDN